jgi:non-ribosomal peptide synthetase component F
VALLAARSPKLRQALRDARKAGHAYLVLDGTLIPIDRVAADRPFYSGKHPQARDEPAGHRQPRR